MSNFQSDGSISNAHVGREFEARAQRILAQHGILLNQNYKTPCSLGNNKKMHTFDLGSDEPPIIVECKSQTWTAGDKVPSRLQHGESGRIPTLQARDQSQGGDRQPDRRSKSRHRRGILQKAQAIAVPKVEISEWILAAFMPFILPVSTE